MPTSVHRFEPTLRELEQAVVAIRRFSSEPIDPSLLAKACADAQRCLTVFGDVLGERSTSSLESFFSAVGAGVISAQRELDKQSIEYIQETIQQYAAPAANPSSAPAATAGVGGQLKGEASPAAAADWGSLSVPPNAAMFRIPRVTAEFKFAVEQTLTKGLNVIFYSNKVESQSLQQQTATIEVVSVPLPPNYRPPAPTLSPPSNRTADRTPERSLEAMVTSTPAVSPSRPVSESRNDKVGSAESSSGSPGGASASSPPAAKPVPKKPVIFVNDSDPPDGEAEDPRSVQTSPPAVVPREPAAPPERLPRSPAVPATPALAGRILDEAARADLFARIAPTIRAMGTAGFAHRRLLSRALQARVLVLADEGHRYFLLLGRGEPQPQLIVWQFSASPPQLQQLLRLRADPQNPSGLSQACRFLERLGREQAAQRSGHGG